MKRVCLALLVLGIAATVVLSAHRTTQLFAAEIEAQLFELRIYTTYPGKLDNLKKRFREHTSGLFKKHGIKVIGYWTLAEDPEAENTFIYVLAHPNLDAREKNWNAFVNDPDWQEAYKASRVNGPLVKDENNRFMIPTDFSPLR